MHNCSLPVAPRGPGGVISESGMVPGSNTMRAVSSIDGQNLFRQAKDSLGHHHPNCDPVKPTEAVCNDENWSCVSVRFRTGDPDISRSAMWHGYWTRRLNAMRNAGVSVTSRPIRNSGDGVPRERGLISGSVWVLFAWHATMSLMWPRYSAKIRIWRRSRWKCVILPSQLGVG